MGKPRHDGIDRLVYLGARVGAMVILCWPVEWCLAGAGLVGDAWFYLMKKHRERALEHLRFSFPEISERERHELARKSMRWIFEFGVEFLFTPRLIRLDSWTKHVTLKNFEPVLRMLMKADGLREGEGKGGGARGVGGVVMLTGHYGNWEVLGYLLATLGFGTTSVARPLDNPYLSRWVYGVREKRGQRIVDKAGALTEVSEVLEQGGAVGFIADQNAGSKGMFVDFFNRKASTYKSIGLAAMRHNAPIVIGYARRRPGKFHFDVGTQDIIYPEDWEREGGANPLLYITQRYTKAIEDFVREDPSQYLWVHRRWKSRPKEELAAKASGVS